MNAADFTVQRFEKNRGILKREFDENYKSMYREIFEHFRPRRGFYVRDGGRATNNALVHGRKMHEKVVNSTSLRVSKNAASGLQAGVTSPSRPWKRIGPATADIQRLPGVAEYYDEVDKGMDYVLSKSNFYGSTQTAYADYVDVGVFAFQVDEHAKDVLRCQVHPIGSWFAASNAEGRVDVFYRDYNPTGHELMSRFDESELPEQLVREIHDNPFRRVEIRNAIEPNPFYNSAQASIGLAAFPYVSVWWCKGYDKIFIRKHGYYEFPVFVARMYKAETNDAYGYGIGFDALPDAKQLMFNEDQSNEAIDKMVTPPMQAPTALRAAGGVSLVRGRVTYHDGPSKIEPLYAVNLPVQYVEQKVQRLEQRLSEHFFEDLFLMITQGVNRQVTAREIQERHEEKLIMLGPVLESLNDEFLDPLVNRVIGIMRRANMLPPAPPALLGVEYRAEYISILAQAQRAVKTVAIEQGVNFTSAMAAAGWPEATDTVNPDPVIEAYLDHIGFPAKAIRTEAERDGIRQQRAQMAQQQRNLEMATQAAPALKQAAEAAKTTQVQPNVLNALLSRVPAAAA